MITGRFLNLAAADELKIATIPEAGALLKIYSTRAMQGFATWLLSPDNIFYTTKYGLKSLMLFNA